MPDRKLIIAGNWKMHKTGSETRALVGELISGIGNKTLTGEIIIAPPFTSLQAAMEEASNGPIQVAAQNMFWEDKGAFTGEISGPMLKEAGCSHVIIGHSERRQYFGETDETVNRKIKAAGRNGLIPIFCLGETLEHRESGKTFEVVENQLRFGLSDIEIPDAGRFVLAYEPVWAIGTGKNATPDQAQEVHAFLRSLLASIYGDSAAAAIRILYGGSVKPDNAKELMSRADIDGGLIGGASLKSSDFLGIIGETI